MTYTEFFRERQERATAEVEKAASAAAKGETATPIAVTLLTGFPRAGKTTLLRYILNAQHGVSKSPRIENEFGEVPLTTADWRSRRQIVPLTNGCIC